MTEAKKTKTPAANSVPEDVVGGDALLRAMETRLEWEDDWLWRSLRRMVDEGHRGSKDRANVAANIGDCLRWIRQTERAAMTRDWQTYVASHAAP